MSGLTAQWPPWATLHFPSREGSDREMEMWWPADFITEGHDQTRGWFYSQLGASAGSPSEELPYKSVLMHGFTLLVPAVP